MWDKVDFVNGQVVVSRSLGRSGLKHTTKTHKSRFIPMNAKVRTILENRFEERLNDQFVFTEVNGDHLDYNHVTERHFYGGPKRSGPFKDYSFSRSQAYVCKSFHDEWREPLYASKAIRAF